MNAWQFSALVGLCSGICMFGLTVMGCVFSGVPLR